MLSHVLLLIVAVMEVGKPDRATLPLVLHRSMEIDDLERELQRTHDTVILKRAQLAASQRLAQKGLVSRGDLERETAELRTQEAREVETYAYRAIKLYERDVLAQVIPADEKKAFSLLLDWVRKQIAIAQVDVDYRLYVVGETRALFAKRAVSRQEMDDAELAFNSAEAGLALARSREAHVLMEIAETSTDKPSGLAAHERLKSDYLKARLQYLEITSEGAHRRLEIARDRSRQGVIPPQEIALFERAAADAEAALAAGRKALGSPESANPVENAPHGGRRDPARNGAW
jgi:hypothetical protein